MPKVSVIVPIYGVEKYIERCARSLFEQTLDDIEYLFIDDRTPDRSIEILQQVLEEYPQRKPQVVIHRMEKNSGQAAVRKWGMQNATGEYVIHCDSDDWVDTDMYRAMCCKAKEENADVIVCDYNEVSEQKTVYKKGMLSESKNDLLKDILCVKVSCSVWNKLVKRDLFTDSFIFPTENMGEDLLINVQFVNMAKKIVHVNVPYYYYINNPLSIVNNPQKKVSVIKRSYENVKQVSSYIERECLEKYSMELTYLKCRHRNYLIPHICDIRIYDLWKDSFKEINYSVLWCRYIPVKERLYTFLLNYHLVYFLIFKIFKIKL